MSKRRRRTRRFLRAWLGRPWAIASIAILVALGLGLGGGVVIGRLWNADLFGKGSRGERTALPAIPAEKPGRPFENVEAPPLASAAPALAPPLPAQPSRVPKSVPAWQRFAVAVPAAEGRPMISIVIDDLGLDRPRTQRALDLPAPLTVAFLPYARDLSGLATRARNAGHEILVHLPMEPESGEVDPGPNALHVRQNKDEILRRLRWALDQVPFHVGANNHMGSLFTRNEAMMTLVLGEMKARGLLFLDSRTTPQSRGEDLARRFGVPSTSRNVFLDDEDSRAAIAAQIKETELQAKRRGFAVAIGHPRDATLEQLAAWLPRLRERGFILVPVSAIVRRNGGA